MVIRKQTFTVGIIALSSMSLFAPTAFGQHGLGAQHAPSAVQQHGPGRHMGAGAQTPAYDIKTETTVKGTVEDVKAGSQVMGPGRRMGAQDRQLALKTDTTTLDVQLGPASFLAEKKVEIGKGDTIEVIGSTVTVGESQVLLAREIRKGDTSWTIRDANGAPLWTTPGHGQHR